MGLVKVPKESLAFFMKNVDNVIRDGTLAEGSWNARLAAKLRNKFAHQHAIMTNSNGSGLVAVLQALTFLSGCKEVAIQSNTFYGMKTVCPSAGYEITHYIDCDPATLMPNVEHITKTIERIELAGRRNDAPVVFLLSHIGGALNPDIKEIAKLIEDAKHYLVEDCAHAVGSGVVDGTTVKYAGTFGIAGVYSFYSTKSIPGGEGGAIVTDNESVADICRRFGIYDRFDQKMEFGFNTRMSEIQALFVYSVLDQIDEIIGNKKELVEKYMRACNDLRIPFIDGEDGGNFVSNHYKFIIGAARPAKFNVAQTSAPVYDYIIDEQVIKMCPGTVEISKSHFSLPTWYGYTDHQVEMVIKELNENKDILGN